MASLCVRARDIIFNGYVNLEVIIWCWGNCFYRGLTDHWVVGLHLLPLVIGESLSFWLWAGPSNCPHLAKLNSVKIEGKGGDPTFSEIPWLILDGSDTYPPLWVLNQSNMFERKKNSTKSTSSQTNFQLNPS